MRRRYVLKVEMKGVVLASVLSQSYTMWYDMLRPYKRKSMNVSVLPEDDENGYEIRDASPERYAVCELHVRRTGRPRSADLQLYKLSYTELTFSRKDPEPLLDKMCAPMTTSLLLCTGQTPGAKTAKTLRNPLAE